MYKPFLFKITNGDLSSLDNYDEETKNIILSKRIQQPMFSMGFHSFLHRTKNAMDITNNNEMKKNKFYYVVNPFEHIINDYKDNISNYTKKYFEKIDNVSVLSRAFYKMWEMINIFDLASSENLTYCAIAEAPGSFLQAIINYRQKFNFNIKKDKLFSVSIHAEKGKHIEMGKQFLGFYKENYPGLITPHKTYTKATASKYKSRDNGDLTELKTINLFKKDVFKTKKYADLVTADGGFFWNDENFQEQEAYSLILGEIITALRVQNKGGHFVLKIFEIFTPITYKLIYILSSFYESCYIYKPHFSRDSNSERYIICKKFKFDQTKDSTYLDKKIILLENILEKMNSELFANDIFPDLKIPQDFINTLKYINIEIANTQQIMINKIVKYIKGNNFFGELYHSYRDTQIKSSKWWISNFYTEKRKKNDDIVEKTIEYNSSEIKLFKKNLI